MSSFIWVVIFQVELWLLIWVEKWTTLNLVRNFNKIILLYIAEPVVMWKSEVLNISVQLSFNRI